MIQALFEFFNTILWSGVVDANDIIYEYWGGSSFVEINGFRFAPADYLCYIFALISFVIIFVLCCLFVYRIVKLVGNLIR